MDLVYMPEALSYGGLRHPQYRDYEQPWNKDYFNYGKSTTKSKPQYRQQVQKPASKVPCLLCKENKRRTLAAYIRGKARNNSCSEIHEEVEELEEEEEEEEQQQQKQQQQEEEERRIQNQETRGEKTGKIEEEEKKQSRRKDENDENNEKTSQLDNNGN